MKTYIIYLLVLFIAFYCNLNKSFSQSTSTGNLVVGSPNTPFSTSPLDYLGWAAGVGQPVLIKNYDVNQPINFWTNYSNFTTTPRMTILGNNNAWPLIGIATATPTTILDIIPPALNNSYALNDTTVLQNWGINNIFCGIGTGFSNISTNTVNGGYSNAFFGYNAGYSNVFGHQNTFAGHIAGFSNDSGYQNVFIGDSAGYFNTYGIWNVFVGVDAGAENGRAGSRLGAYPAQGNCFVGIYAGENNQNGSWNTFTGTRAGEANLSSFNSYYGKDAGWENEDGYDNCFYGAFCDYGGLPASLNTEENQWNAFYGYSSGYDFKSGDANSYYGSSSGYSLVSDGYYNTFLGESSGYLFTSGMDNTCVGRASGRSLISGNDNLFLGSETQYVPTSPPAYLNSLTNAAAIGAYAIVGNSNQTIIGNSLVQNVAIGYSLDPIPPPSQPSLPEGLFSVNDITPTTIASGHNTGIYVNVAPGAINYPNHIIYGENVLATNAATGSATTCGINSKSVVTSGGASLSSWGGTAIGVFGEGEHTNHGYDENVGVCGWTNGGDYLNYGVYGYAPTPPYNTNNAAGFFNGNLVYTGAFLFSDSTLKDSIQTLTNAMSIINQLNPKSYYFKVDSFPTVSLPSGKQYGLISQQVARVLPGLTDTFAVPQPLDSMGNADSTAAIVKILSLNYTELTPFLVGGEQQLSQSIDSLRTGIDSLSSDFGYGLVSHALKTLPGDIGMHLNSYNILYSGQDTAKAKLGIGYDSGTVNLPAKLSVNEAVNSSGASTIAGYFHDGDTSSTGSIQGTQITVDGQGQTITGVGVFTDGSSTEGAYDMMLQNYSTTGGGLGGIEMDIFGNSTSGSTGIDMKEYAYVTSGDVIGLSIDAENNYDFGNNGNDYGIISFAYTGNSVYGGQFYAYGNIDEVGVYTTTSGGAPGLNYALWAVGPPGGGDSATASTSAAAYLDGDVVCTGNAYGFSDAQLKDNVQPLQNAMATINQLNPKSYTYKTKDFSQINLPSGTQYGLIAQDVENILPQLVKSFKAAPPVDTATHTYDPNRVVDVKALNYTGFIPFLIEGMKEQQQTIDSLKAQQQSLDSLNDSLNSRSIQQRVVNQNMQNAIDTLISQMAQLQNVVNGCCASTQRKSSQSDTSTINVTLSNTGGIILNQNDPNPFAESTTITFNIPSSVNEAKIIFFDNLGHVINTVVINDRGPGRLDVYASNLSSGVYSYSLLADGTVVDTKKMVCTK